MGTSKLHNKDSIWTKRATSTKVGLKETEINKASTRLIRKKLYELVRFLRTDKVRASEFGHGRNRFEVGVAG